VVNGTSHAQDRPQPDNKDIIDVSTDDLQPLDMNFLDKLEGDDLKTMEFDGEEHEPSIMSEAKGANEETNEAPNHSATPSTSSPPISAPNSVSSAANGGRSNVNDYTMNDLFDDKSKD
jgi:hypothetical protein